MVFVFLCLTYFSQYDNLQVHPCYFKWWKKYVAEYVPKKFTSIALLEAVSDLLKRGIYLI